MISTAIKRGKAGAAWVRDAVRSMITLNRTAAEIVTSSPGYEVHGMTDVTGFGLIGHAREMAIGSGVSLRIHASRVPLLEGAMECVRAGYVPGGLKANRTFAESCVEFADAVPEEIRTLLFDPQTAGGLLISVAENDAARLVAALRSSEIDAIEIGEVIPKQKPLIAVT